MVAVVADAQGLLSVAPNELPPFGTFWAVRNSLPCLTVPMPFPPDDTNLVVYAIGDGHFLVDDMAGSLVGPLPPAYANRFLGTEDYAAIVEAQADELTDFVTRLQAWLPGGGVNRESTLDTDPPPSPGGGGDGFTDPGVGMSFSGISHGTNQLWIELLTPFATNGTASLVIHPPWDWDSLTGTYDLLTCTNLTPPVAWQWVMRTDPGQTNVTVSVTSPQRFYRLSLPNDLLATSSLGTNFWIAFFAVDNLPGTNLSVYISSSLGATGTLTVPGLGITNAFAVDAGAMMNIALTSSVMMVEYDVVETNGVHITASQPVAVYGVDYSDDVTSAFTGYPTTLLGTNYCLMSRAAQDGWPEDPDSYSQFAIVATANNTTVHIVPSPTADLYQHTNAYYVTNLQQGQTYQIRSTDKNGDVTGTLVTSDKPVGVFAGANIAWVPDINSAAANPLVQEQLPVETWGRQALALSFAARKRGDTYRVLAANNSTVVFTNGVVAGTNQAGQFLEMLLDGPVEFKASQPIQVAHFANGLRFDDMIGDPCEILLPPAGHYLRTNIVFALPNDLIKGDFDVSFLSIIVPQSAIASTLVDGSTVDATNFVAIGASGYYGTQISVANMGTNASVHSVISSQPVGVEFYGFGAYDSYGGFGGMVK